MKLGGPHAPGAPPGSYAYETAPSAKGVTCITICCCCQWDSDVCILKKCSRLVIHWPGHLAYIYIQACNIYIKHHGALVRTSHCVLIHYWNVIAIDFALTGTEQWLVIIMHSWLDAAKDLGCYEANIERAESRTIWLSWLSGRALANQARGVLGSA